MNFILHDTKIKYSLIFAFLVYNFINFFYMPSHIIFPDESRFLDEALKFSNTFEFWSGNSRAWEMPLTAIIYGFFVKIFGSFALFSIRVFQSLLVLLSGVFIYKLSLMLFNKRVAFISMIIFLFYPFFIYYQSLLLSETLFITFLIIAFYYLYKWQNNRFLIDKNLFISMLFFVLGIYIKATLTILPILIFPFFVLFYKGFKYSIKVFLISLVTYIVLMSPWWIRNYLVLDKMVIFTTSSGSNLYLGNNIKNPKGGIDWKSDVDKKFVISIKKSNLSEIQKDKIFKQKAIEFIKNNPEKFLKVMWLKFKRFWNIQFNNEHFRNSLYNYIMLFTFIPILIGFIFSLFLLYKDKKLYPIFLLIFYFTLLHSIVIASLRYRLPIEPILIILASYSFDFIYRKLKKCKN